MLHPTQIAIEANGTKLKKEKAIAEGKDPDEVFSLQWPDVDLYEEGEELDLQEDVGKLWGLKDNSYHGFIKRVLKHVKDAKRADFHRGDSVAKKRKALMSEFMSLDPTQNLTRIQEIQTELQAL